MIVDPDLLVPDMSKTIEEGAFEAWAGSTSNYYPQFLAAVCEHYGIPTDVPVSQLSRRADEDSSVRHWRRKIRFRYENDFGQSQGSDVPFEGIIHNLERRYRETASDGMREYIEGI